MIFVIFLQFFKNISEFPHGVSVLGMKRDIFKKLNLARKNCLCPNKKKSKHILFFFFKGFVSFKYSFHLTQSLFLTSSHFNFNKYTLNQLLQRKVPPRL